MREKKACKKCDYVGEMTWTYTTWNQRPAVIVETCPKCKCWIKWVPAKDDDGKVLEP